MSTHAFPLPDGRRVSDIVLACHEASRAPASVAWDGTTLSLTFEPDLTAGEASTLADLVAAYQTVLTLAEYRTIKGDIAGLATFLGIASPTNAQRDAATKALIRVLRAVVRS